jgi:hypothetical protein
MQVGPTTCNGAACQTLVCSERLRKAGILQNLVCGDARPQLLVDGEVHPRYGIPPNLMIATALPLEFIASRSEESDKVTIIVGHTRSAGSRQPLTRTGDDFDRCRHIGNPLFFEQVEDHPG